jgi:hypothetical protein
VLVLTAVELEARALARLLELARCSRFPFPVYDRPTNTGRARLRVAPLGLRAALLSERWPALVAELASPLVISAGTCGALAPGLEVGDLVLPESVLGPTGERLYVTPGAHQAALQRAPDAWAGLLLTSAELVGTPEAKALRWRDTGASAVDMESAGILAWASRRGCPALIVRAVSDTARQHISAELAGLVTPEGKLRAGRAVTLALTRPGSIADALALRRGTAVALKRVARLLATLVQ